MDVSGLTSAYSDYYSNLASNSSTSALSSKISGTDASSATDEELMEVCKEFESYLLEQVFKNMEDTVKIFSDDDEDSSSSQLVDYFKDEAIQELCSTATDQNSVGLAQMLYDQLKVNASAISASELAEKMAENAADSGVVTE